MNNEILIMLEKLFNNEYDVNDFSYEFQELLLNCDDKTSEIFDNAPEICEQYDSSYNGEAETINAEQLKAKIRPMYEQYLKYLEESTNN